MPKSYKHIQQCTKDMELSDLICKCRRETSQTYGYRRVAFLLFFLQKTTSSVEFLNGASVVI
ncbi:MAG: hypothetical protein IJU04_03540 [Ruminococcus sp.]|nr:hypothetical protein [Ruminococcus sp.]